MQQPMQPDDTLLSARDKRRLKMCCSALGQLHEITTKPHPCYFNTAEKTRIDVMDALIKECLENERGALIRKANYIAANNTPETLALWKLKDAADDFIFSNTAAERVGKRQPLEKLMRASFPPDSVSTYANSLAAMPLKTRPIDAVYGGIFIAAVEGCDDFDRIVGHYDFDIDNETRLNHRHYYQGLENATAVYLRPFTDIVSWEMEIQSHTTIKTSKEWAAYEKREQMYRHGINKVFNGGGCSASTFLSICLSKTLCVRCGCSGHTSSACRALYKAAWAGGNLIVINSA
jgi:hypothetical protein